jgi:hypothetical protein
MFTKHMGKHLGKDTNIIVKTSRMALAPRAPGISVHQVSTVEEFYHA